MYSTVGKFIDSYCFSQIHYKKSKQNFNSMLTLHNHNTVRWPNNFTAKCNTQTTFSIIFLTISFHILAFRNTLFLLTQIPKCLPNKTFNKHFSLQETHIKSAIKWHTVIANRDVFHGRIFPNPPPPLLYHAMFMRVSSFLQSFKFWMFHMSLTGKLLGLHITNKWQL
jgi:hypothetical protein